MSVGLCQAQVGPHLLFLSVPTVKEAGLSECGLTACPLPLFSVEDALVPLLGKEAGE